MNRLTQTSTGSGVPIVSTTGYDAAGQVTSSKDPNGNVTQYGYDDAGRRTSVTNALNQVTSFAYDNVGNQTSMTDALLHTTTYTYDPENRRTQVTYPDNTFDATGYDALGRVTSITDANGKVTADAYDALGRLTSVTQDASSSSNPGGLNLLTQYTYDEVGNRLTQTDANQHTTSYFYDNRGRRTERILPAGQSETYQYDANGNASSKTDFNGRTTTYTYDSMNRVLTKTADPYFATNHIGAAQVSYTYTASGKQNTMTDASGTTTFRYDFFDRLSEKLAPAGILNYSYDLASNLSGLSAGNLTYGYDALNRLSSVTWNPGGFTFLTASYAYDAVGNLQSVTYPNGVVQTYAYDAKNRLTSLGVKNATATLESYTYTVDNAGHRTSVTEQSGRTVNYSYDNLYRLTNETVASDPNGINGVASYTYDNVGNRLQKTSTLPGYPGGSNTYNANDELTTDQYDADGNTVGSGLNTGTSGYVYDFENRLVQQAGISIVYDGNGNRVQKTVAGATTQYQVADVNPTGYPQVVADNSSTYIYGLELVVRRQGSTDRYYVHDGHGSVRALTDDNGNITDTYDYDAFGVLTHSTGTTPNNYLFAGEEYDPDLHLYYNRARYLNTSTGRFWTMDTFEGDVQSPLSLHKYLYAGVDPADNLDPTGLFTQSFGYAVEEDVQGLYELEHPGHDVSYGLWARVGTPSRSRPYSLKPDILDRTSGTWIEIKPLSLTGLAAASAAYALYTLELGQYNPDPSWPNPPRVRFVQDRSVGIVNVGGIILYTDAVLDTKELLTITSFAAAAELLTKVPPQAVANAVSEVVDIARLVKVAIAGTEAELADVAATSTLLEAY